MLRIDQNSHDLDLFVGLEFECVETVEYFVSGHVLVRVAVPHLTQHFFGGREITSFDLRWIGIV